MTELHEPSVAVELPVHMTVGYEAALRTEQGVPRTYLTDRIALLIRWVRRLEHERDEAKREHDAVGSALTSVQERCTALFNENRTLRLAGSHEAIFCWEILAEVARGRAKHGHEGTAPLFAALIEETGEVAKALLENESDQALRAELSQVAAVCIRIAVEGCVLYGRTGLDGPPPVAPCRSVVTCNDEAASKPSP